MRKALAYTRFARKTLMKLTPRVDFTNIQYVYERLLGMQNCRSKNHKKISHVISIFENCNATIVLRMHLLHCVAFSELKLQKVAALIEKFLLKTQNATGFKLANVKATQNIGMTDKRCL